MALVKTVEYRLEGRDVVVTVSKWTVSKFVGLIKDIGEIAQLLGEDFRFDKALGAKDLAKLLLTLGDEASKRITKLITQSVTKPKVTEADVGEWDLEDYIGVLTSLIELNFTENLRKNFRSLKGALSEKVRGDQMSQQPAP